MLSRKIGLVTFAVGALLAAGSTVGTALAADGTPRLQNPAIQGEEQVRQLVVVMNQGESQKVSKQEFMKFMAAQFDRLDRNKSGELDAREIQKSEINAIRPRTFSSVGK